MEPRGKSDDRPSELDGHAESGHVLKELASIELPGIMRVEGPDAGTRWLGRYHLIETLGQGGMGTIHLAVVGGLGRFRKLVVLKVLREDLTLNPTFVEMFMREAALAACLNHPNVVQTVEAGQEGSRYFLVMDFLDGQPYSKLLRVANRDPVMPLALRLRVICDALLGLHYAHELTDYDGQPLSMVHCDVSPPNVFVTYDGQVKLLDFGIARARDMATGQPRDFTGKLGYAAPEQLRGEAADRRIDVFAAGIVLWEAIALRHLSQGRPLRQTVAARLAGTEPRIAEVVPDVDPELAAICDRAMHREPEARFPTAEAFRLALQSYLVERGEPADAQELKRFMRTKFAEERAAMHRRIDAHLRWGNEVGSSVTSLTSALLTQGERSGAHLQQRRSAPPTERDPMPAALPLDPQRAIRWLGMAGVLALALMLPLWLVPSPESQPLEHPVPAPKPVPDAAPAAPSSSAEVVPSAAPAAPEPAPRASAVEVDASLASGTGSAERRAAESELRHAPVERASRPRRASRALPSATTVAREAGVAGKPPADAGELDLRSVPKRAPRAIDLDNPFR